MTRGLPQAPVSGISWKWRGTGVALLFSFRACPPPRKRWRANYGVLYLRGHSRTRGAVRTFRLANVESVVIVPNARPTARIPADPWGDEDPRYGIDEDRPSEARERRGDGALQWASRDPGPAGVRRQRHQHDDRARFRHHLLPCLDVTGAG
jgi:hypothetical protein